MTRPAVSVVMPFAGDRAEAMAAVETLRALAVGPGDELILVDNEGTAPAPAFGVTVVRASGERSPSHARNVGAERARCDWILFLDADCQAPSDLLDRFFAAPIAPEVGALAGAVTPAAGGRGLAARYGEAHAFLGLDAHLAHPYLPRAVAANLLVRREAFEAIGGFYEGVRAAEDTDFTWRLQRAGWRLVGRPEARVEHRYRTSLGALRRQWRGYAAGRAWLARRYDGFVPEPALARALRRMRRGGRRDARVESGAVGPAGGAGGRAGGAEGPEGGARGGGRGRLRSGPHLRLRGGGFLALDAVLGVEELAGFVLSNHPLGREASFRARVVLVADRFPVPGDPLTDLALAVAGGRVEARARPEAIDRRTARALRIDYREDDGAAARGLALVRLAVRHPVRCARDAISRWARDPATPSLSELAPAVLRLAADPGARVHPLGGGEARPVAGRLARLAGRPLES